MTNFQSFSVTNIAQCQRTIRLPSHPTTHLPTPLLITPIICQFERRLRFVHLPCPLSSCRSQCPVTFGIWRVPFLRLCCRRMRNQLCAFGLCARLGLSARPHTTQPFTRFQIHTHKGRVRWIRCWAGIPETPVQHPGHPRFVRQSFVWLGGAKHSTERSGRVHSDKFCRTFSSKKVGKTFFNDCSSTFLVNQFNELKFEKVLSVFAFEKTFVFLLSNRK